jgi:hypothetical protein
MTFKEFWRREKFVALHAQTVRFRIVKYIVILALLGGVYVWRGVGMVGILFAAMFVFAIALHFFFRWKTEAWTKSWGPYKYIPLEE